MSDDDNNSDQFDPIGEIKEFVIRFHSQGKLPVLTFGFVILYNILVFSYPQGFELYSIIPVICFIVPMLLSYWKDRENHKRMIISSFFLLFGAVFDLIVSTSFIFNSWGYDWGSLPTAIADILTIITYMLWYVKIGIDQKYLMVETTVTVK